MKGLCYTVVWLSILFCWCHATLSANSLTAHGGLVVNCSVPLFPFCFGNSNTHRRVGEQNGNRARVFPVFHFSQCYTFHSSLWNLRCKTYLIYVQNPFRCVKWNPRLICCVWSEWSDQPTAVSHLYPVLWTLPHPQTGRDKTQAIITPGWEHVTVFLSHFFFCWILLYL